MVVLHIIGAKPHYAARQGWYASGSCPPAPERRVSKDATSAAFKFTERCFPTSGLYGLEIGERIGSSREVRDYIAALDKTGAQVLGCTEATREGPCARRCRKCPFDFTESRLRTSALYGLCEEHRTVFSLMPNCGAIALAMA